jgi:hypothetical protein
LSPRSCRRNVFWQIQSLIHQSWVFLFDSVICGVHFDDCRIFELLHYIREVDHFEKLPFLVITAQPSSSVYTDQAKLGPNCLAPPNSCS